MAWWGWLLYAIAFTVVLPALLCWSELFGKDDDTR
jgi:hypothetical protein